MSSFLEKKKPTWIFNRKVLHHPLNDVRPCVGSEQRALRYRGTKMLQVGSVGSRTQLTSDDAGNFGHEAFDCPDGDAFRLILDESDDVFDLQKKEDK